ncbi:MULTISPECIES: DUF554 domain-containing protein [Psychrilyobacter]|uniref:DUF554 family protein n=1 Tax=Psychrilyobacter piezotolerans TaxID=2293438 RepID=A0ABX9KHH8_9FUSO|nr:MULTISPECIES: DUF554 domain-containing protein [Psychrilyobacter]MCS5421218.1 DUF554 domain-containing protein [Psychrilyobacter sp. S5]NDI77591.1 DUF554 domain-containing protein [Psychrilyobacter piezotolerans]RDE62602.1 DUF554 domain-containing protein [Psychrilyobacter sp. S5]REI41532.1 DUF554 family protein [Psychrilyobacter piezotolerans]
MTGIMINTASIVGAGFIGSLFGKKIDVRYREGTMTALGLVALTIGIGTIAQVFPLIKKPLIFIISLSLGSLLGEWINLEGSIKKFTEKKRGSGMEGLLTCIFLFSLGSMSILGPIQSALNNDNTLLIANAILSGVASFFFASTFGKIISFSAFPLLIIQGSIFFLAKMFSNFITDSFLIEITLLGGIFILVSGLNILKISNIRSLNLLPSLLFPVIFSLFGWL